MARAVVRSRASVAAAIVIWRVRPAFHTCRRPPGPFVCARYCSIHDLRSASIAWRTGPSLWHRCCLCAL